ncbi:MAG: iron ABC transporter permease [Proteobacteria bacterium]|nr:iron ABC transporter permease [Pseudomonadota bacterium]
MRRPRARKPHFACRPSGRRGWRVECGEPQAATHRERRVVEVRSVVSESRRDFAVTTTLILFAILVVAFAVSFLLGASDQSAGALFAGLFGGQGIAGLIAREIRLPRALLGLIVGAGLGASGAALQGLFRNPLAEPGVTGVTSSAGLGAVIALYFGLAASNPFALPVFAIVGALASAAVLYLLSRAGAGAVALVLAGVAVASLATALTALALSFAKNPYAMSEMVLWMMGSLKDRTMTDVVFALPLTLLGIALLLSAARGLDALTLGEDAAESLGVAVGSVRMRVVVGVALATGAATAAAGAVSFVGLVVPHVLRRFYGYAPSRLILPSALGGAVLVTAADVLIRIVAPDGQLLLGVLTAMLGAPFFLLLIFRLRSEA